MKENVKSPAIDIDMLTMALQAGDLDTGWWLDTHSGDVIPAPEENGDSVEQQLIDKSHRDPDRFIVIEPVAETIHFELMESFISTLEEEAACAQLYEALQKKQPGWHFKNVLSGMPECEDEWYAFKEQFYALQARQWLRDRLLEYKEVSEGFVEKQIQTVQEASRDTITWLELKLEHENQQRRYLIWQQDSELMLTLIQQQQLLAEKPVNQHQMSGINHILETYRPYIDTTLNEQQPYEVHMSYRGLNSSGEIQGALKNEPFQTLVMTLDIMLGVPLLKA